jgi:SNF2-related domain/SNF2 Helicase protein/Helicase conserved C-terminal domain
VFAVHALWSPGRGVLLWAEDGERPATRSSRAQRSARPHPFAVPAQTLAAVHPGTPTQVTLLLPGRGGGPLASPELVRSAPAAASRGEPELRAWAVPAVVVDSAELNDPADELRYGASVDHLRAVAALAADLAARGRVLPTLDPAAPPRARWRPVVTGLDAAAFEALAAAMPPVAHAEQSGRGAVRAGAAQDPAALVSDALDVLVDAAVRDRLARMDMTHRGGRTVVDAWLAALTTPDGRLPPGTRLDPLVEGLREWDTVGTEPPGAAQAVFRLAEVRALGDDGADYGDVTGDGTRWQLEFLLQSTTDPSLLVPAERVWAGAADRLIAGPQEVLLAELGRAARVYPPLAPALRRARPNVLDLGLEGAHHVLTAGAALLVEAGFGVQLPAGWDGGRRVGLRLSARSTPAAGVVVRGGLGREQVADFRWSVAVGDGADAVLDEEEIAALVAAKAPLVRLRGTWVSVDQERLRKGLAFLRSGRGRRAPSAAEVLELAAGDPSDGDLPLPLTGIDAEGWLGDLLAGSADRTLAPVDPPPDFGAQLRPYQQRGVAWLAFLSSLGLGACLADDMGLGKTVQLLALEAHDRATSDGAEDHPGPTLLVCPMSMVGTWEREAARFAPSLRVRAHHGPGRARGADLRAALDGTDLLVTTYATAARDADDLADYDWHRLVLDEAQAVKNARSVPARAVRRFRARHRVALTGTPVENRLAELWAIMDVLNPGILGTAERFRTRYAIPVERHGNTDAAELLRRTTRPYLLRRLKTDPTIVDDLPEKIEITQHYRLTREQASLYRTIVDDMLEKIEDSQGIARRGNVLAAMTKLKQVCNHPAQLLHDGSPVGRRSGKVARLEEILAEVLAEGDRALCFTQFTEFGHLLVPHLSARLDTDVAFLHGGLPRARREEMVRRFQDGPTGPNGGPKVLLLSLKAGGSGLTLTAANHVVHLDRWWNPAVEEQATDRAFRIGQRRNVQVRKFLCPGTVEERIDALVRSKRALSQLVVGDGESWLTELSTTQLRELFALGADAQQDSEEQDEPDDVAVEPARSAR